MFILSPLYILTTEKVHLTRNTGHRTHARNGIRSGRFSFVRFEMLLFFLAYFSKVLQGGTSKGHILIESFLFLNSVKRGRQ